MGHKIEKNAFSETELQDWLKPLYTTLQFAWQAKHLAQTMSFKYQSKLLAHQLIEKFIQLMFCLNPAQDAKNGDLIACGKCHSCALLKAQTHPDFYVIQCLKDKKLIAIDQIRALQNHVYEASQQGGIRLIWIQEAELLSDAAANALLKMVEEQPQNCYFIFSHKNSVELMPTLKSRSLCFTIQNPSFDIGLNWLEQKWQKLPKFVLDQNRSHQFASALLLMQNEPVNALDLLRSKLWQQRAVFYQKIEQALIEKNLWKLRSFFTDSQTTAFFITCLQTLILDAIKGKNKAGAFIVNRDFAPLVRQLLQFNLMKLDKVFSLWQQTEIEMNTILAVNEELLIANVLAQSELILF